jgi:hypothetical protein
MTQTNGLTRIALFASLISRGGRRKKPLPQKKSSFLKPALLLS